MSQKVRSFLFLVAGVALLLGAALYLTRWVVAPYLFAAGAAGVAVCHLTLPARTLDLRRKRLHQMDVIASLLMIVASGLMFDGNTAWVICLTIAAILQAYTAFAAPGETPEKD